MHGSCTWSVRSRGMEETNKQTNGWTEHLPSYQPACTKVIYVELCSWKGIAAWQKEFFYVIPVSYSPRPLNQAKYENTSNQSKSVNVSVSLVLSFTPASLRDRIWIWVDRPSLPPRHPLLSLWRWRTWCVRSERTPRCSCPSTTPMSTNSSGISLRNTLCTDHSCQSASPMLNCVHAH